MQQRVVLRGRAGGVRLDAVVQAVVAAAMGSLLQAGHGEVVQDGEQPGAGIAVCAALVPAADGALQRVLHQVIRGGAFTQQRAGVGAQRRDQRLDQMHHVLHGGGDPFKAR